LRTWATAIAILCRSRALPAHLRNGKGDLLLKEGRAQMLSQPPQQRDDTKPLMAALTCIFLLIPAGNHHYSL